MSDNPYTPPSADLSTPNTSQTIELATRGKRLGAAIIDCLISMAIIFPLMYFTGGFEAIRQGQENSMTYTLIFGLVGFIIFILIHGRLLYLYGQTVGKRALGIKISDLDGNLPTLTRHIVPRYVFATVLAYIPVVGSLLSIIDVLFIFGKNRRCVHDYVAQTIVITDN